MPAPDVLRTPDDVTPDWLTGVLRRDGLLDQAAVTTVTREPVGAGLMGVCTRLGLTLDRHEPMAPASVIAKFAAADEGTRAFMATTGYLNEVCFYSEFARRLGIATPRCSYGAIDADGWFTLVLEDLAPARPGDQLAGCSVEEAELAVMELVGLHAPLWDSPELGSHPQLGARALDPDLVAAGLAATVPGFLERYGAALDGAAVDFYRRLGEHGAAWVRARPAPRTLTHGDYRPDNLLFGTRADGEFVVAVDWQGLSHGSGNADVAFLLGTALRIEERRAHEERIVRRYHSALAAAGVTGYGWDECWSDYRAALLSGLFTTIFGSMYGARTERGDAMFALMAERQAAQALDLGADHFL